MHFKSEVAHNNKRLEVRAVLKEIVPDCTTVRAVVTIEGVTLPSFNLGWSKADSTSREPAQFKFYTTEGKPFTWSYVTVEEPLAVKLAELVEGWYWEHQRSLPVKLEQGAQ
jgi:hypothetical protein